MERGIVRAGGAGIPGAEQPWSWNVRNLGVARCLIGQAGRVNHESASSDISMDAVALSHQTDLRSRRIP